MRTTLSYLIWPFVIAAGTYGTYIVFGTFSDPDRHVAGEIGVRDDPIPEDFLAQLLSPFTWSQLVKESASPKEM